MHQWQNDGAEVLPLDGTWSFSLDGQSGTIQVPGVWEAQGYARRVDGPARYRRTVVVPGEWAGRRIQLQFDAVSYYAEVTINGAAVGTHTGSWSPFALDVTEAIRPGTENEITVTVTKPGGRFPLRESLAGFLPDVAVMFGGLWQPVRLVAFPGPALSQITIRPDAASGDVTITARLHHAASREVTITITSPDGRPAAIWQGRADQDTITARLNVPDARLWSPEQPQRYTAEIALEGARARRSFGFRRLSRDGERLLLNGVPVCLRGVLNWGWYPELLCPAPDEQTIRDEFRRVRELGYNLIKLCLYVPSPRYFEIADEEGMLLWLEFPLWLPVISPHLRAQAPLEYAEILAAVHHHPSIVIYSLGCELESTVDPAFVETLDSIIRGGTADVLVCDNSGSGEAYGALTDLADFNDYHFYSDLQFFEPLIDHFSRDWREPRPWIFGEFCDADDFRDLRDLAVAYGGELPWWATEQNPIHPLSKLAYSEQFKRMENVDLPLDHQALVRLSRRQSFMIRKTILEKVRARAGMGGYVVTSIRDTPLATSSMFDDFGRAKYEPGLFRTFNADTVLLLGRGRARRWTFGGDRPAPFDPYSFVAGQRMVFDVILSHAGKPLPGGTLGWRLTRDDGTILADGSAPIHGPLDGDRPRSIRRLVFDAPASDQPQQLRLETVLEMGDQDVQNAWSLWIFPEVSVWPASIGLLDPTGSLIGLDDLWAHAARQEGTVGDVAVLITTVLTREVLEFLRGGGSVLLLQQGDHPLPALALPFWRESIKIIGDHPVMAAFPHTGMVDMQFYGLATDWAFDSGRLASTLPDAANVRPLLRRLDARQFTVSDYLIEAQVGAGRLIATTLRFQGGLGDQPAGLRAQVAARWLLYRLLMNLKG